MANRVRWDQYEAAILLDAYVKYIDGLLTRSQAIEKVSTLLRKRALLAGEMIDSSYRNEAGISFQLGVMQFAMTDGQKGIAQRSKLFQDTVKLYRTKPGEFALLLQTALTLSEDVDAATAASRRETKSMTIGGTQEQSKNRTVSSSDPLIDEIRKRGIWYTDKRAKKGCLWIIGGDEHSDFVREMRKLGVQFYFKKKGARAIGGRSGWWTKDYARKQASTAQRSNASSQRPVGHTNNEPRTQSYRVSRLGGHPSPTADFRRWMMGNGLAESSARSYSSAITNAEQFAKSHGYDDIVFYGNADAESVEKMIDQLFNDPRFARYNDEQHNRLRSAFRKYVEYIGGTVSFDKGAVESVRSEPKSDLPTAVQTAILEVVAAGFPNGVRLGSVIDRKKIGRLYKERTGEEPPNDEDTEACLASNGTLYDGKIYLIGGATRQEIRERLENECRRGHRILYYEELYKVAAEYYASKMIYSSDALKRVIEAAGARVVFYKNYCATTRDVTIEDELVRAFGPEVRLSVDELQRRLPFIPADKLTPSLSSSRRFVRVRAGEYARVDGIVIDENDVTDATALVESEIAAHGFASLGNVDLTRTLANNPFLSETAIRDAFFIRVLADDYSKKGQIVTREGEAASANEVMRELCRSLDVATLEDLDEIEKAVTGQARNAILPIAFDAMIRIDRDTFVSNGQVNFDVAAVDEALAFFVGTGITPIKAITSFNSIPYVGRPWTLYLLESYLARYSDSYTISGGPARSDNVGAIYPKDKKFGNYGDVLAQVLADSTLDLNGNAAADYLIRVGFVLRKTALVKTAMERARTLRDIRGR